MQIVRTYSAGVFAVSGIDNRSKDGKRGTLRNARRLWYWSGAASLSELASRGTSNPSGCKFPATVDWIDVTEIIEVLPVSTQAEASINSVSIWSV